MEQGKDIQIESLGIEQKSPLYKVTPLSKYLAMLLFVILPFLGGWVGYNYAPSKVVEVAVVQSKESSTLVSTTTGNSPVQEIENLKDWITYTDDYARWSMKYPSNWRYVITSPKAPGSVGFGPSEIKEDVAMGVYVATSSETNISNLIENQVSFSNVKRLEFKPVTLNGKAAIKVSSVLKDTNEIGRVCFYLQENNLDYQLCNWGKSDEEFNRQVKELTGKDSNVSFKDFYESFKIAD